MAQRDDLDDESLSSSSTEDASEPSQDSLTIQQASRPSTITHLSPYTVAGNVASPKPVFLSEMQHVKDNIGTSRRTTPNEEEKKKEHKKRSKNWTRAETLKLINARTELDERFRRSGKKVALWDEIALSLKKDGFSRDGQQCKDKWEKLTAAYKDVRDGAREKEDHPFYEELHALLSWKSYKRENEVSASGDGISIRRDEGLSDGNTAKRVKFEFGNERFTQGWNQIGTSYAVNSQGDSALDMREAQKHEQISPIKLNREGSSSFIDFEAIQELLETVIIKQQMFFKELLDSIERKEQLREKMRYEREEKWRAEERSQRYAFNSAMIALTNRLLGEKQAVSMGATPSVAQTETPPTDGLPGPKKRSKNWKKSEVFTLIRLRREMEGKFSQSTRRAALWEELGEKLGLLGIQRDGKQCREKWDKLMAEYKDVTDGRKDEEESPYFKELSTFLGKLKEPEEVRSGVDVTKKEVVETGGPLENNF